MPTQTSLSLPDPRVHHHFFLYDLVKFLHF